MTDPGCPRCRDYEQLKRELDNQKEHLKEKQNKELLSCEKEKKLLQKKVLQYGAAAVIGGTILGKEFVDNVASYIDSFNSISNITGVASSAPSSTNTVASVTTTDEPSSQDPTPKSTVTKTIDRLSPNYFYSAAIDPFTINFDGSALYADPFLTNMMTVNSFSSETPEDPMEYLQKLTKAFSDIEKDSFTLTIPPYMNFNEYTTDELLNDQYEDYVVVSDNYAYVTLLTLPFLFRRRRRS